MTISDCFAEEFNTTMQVLCWLNTVQNLGRFCCERKSTYTYASSDSDLEFNLGVVNHMLEDPSTLFWPQKCERSSFRMKDFSSPDTLSISIFKTTFYLI